LNPLQFFKEVRQETAKVTWPSQKEVLITTVAVLIMVVMTSVFFLAVDQVIGTLLSLLLGIGH
jgi:preprotein translocase subunit SecE